MQPPSSLPYQLRRQAIWCERLGSPLYSHLLSRCADDYESGGASRALLLGHENDSDASMLPLSLMGAIHRLVLEGEVARLTKFYPSVGGTPDCNGAWLAFRDTVQQQKDTIRSLIKNPVQTNDVGRSGSLFGGFGVISQRTRMPLRLLEVGTSAGLNLRWDRFRYEWSGGGWGELNSAVRLENVFVDAAPSIPPRIEIVERAGCDPSPVDVHTDSGRLTLISYIWADQVDRIRRLQDAISIARTTPCVIDKAGGADWLEERLQKSFPGAATVIFHSLVWPYMSKPERKRITAVIENAGNRASENAPVAWLTMEPNRASSFEIRLRIYPGFEEQVIATSLPHAPAVHWLYK